MLLLYVNCQLPSTSSSTQLNKHNIPFKIQQEQAIDNATKPTATQQLFEEFKRR